LLLLDFDRHGLVLRTLLWMCEHLCSVRAWIMGAPNL
jgi:hypothetical protein